MRRTNIISTLGLAATLMMASCAKEELGDFNAGTGEGKIKINYTVEEPWSQRSDATETRASGISPSDEQAIADVWIFQFDGTSESSLLFAPPLYLSGAQVTSPTPFANGGSTTQRFVFLANLGDPEYQWNMLPGQSVLQELKNKIKAITTENELYSGNRLLMAGEITSTTGVSGITVQMRHCMARIQLDLTVPASAGVTVDAAQLCNVPSEMYIYESLFSRSGIFPANNTVTAIDYAPSASNIPASNGVASQLYWYMPVNMKGSVTNSNPKLKNIYAPVEATYIKIYAHDNSSPAKQVVYIFYPGENTTNNFDIKCNGNYRLSVTIRGVNDYTVDSRIDNIGVVRFRQAANTYILNPPVANASTVYRIYPSQVDRFWGEFYENVPSNMLGESVPWRVQLIWQDEPDIVRPSGTSNIIISKSTGAGVSDYFDITVPKNAKHGSFVLGVYKDSDLTLPLWSWHFWVTDYNPDVNHVPPVPNKFVYPVAGGAVHRYNTSVFTASNGVLKNGFVMDRNLGQREDYPEQIASTSKGYFFYQWGRKDPFPTNTPLYDINGGSVTYSNNANATQAGYGSGKGLAYAVQHPLTFMMHNNMRSYDNWADGYDFGEGDAVYPPIRRFFYYWHDKATLLTYNMYYFTIPPQKSLYDPCPAGWRLAPNTCFYNFTVDSDVNNNNRTGLEWYRDNRSGLRYWPMINVDGNFPVNGRIYFPSNGGGRNTNGSFTASNGSVYMWSSSIIMSGYSPTYNYGYFFSPGAYNVFTSTSVSYSLNYRSYAYSVRCVSDPSYVL
ncbi:MAG: DUF4906 domain-containing protein [Rikenellaceae bacterium]|jgi:hypothetical protein|nr:DUF4906 domain-containing protein [Rikenellaceae bacterium]